MKSNEMWCSVVIVLSIAVQWMKVGSDESSDSYPDKVCIKSSTYSSRVSATDEYQMPK